MPIFQKRPVVIEARQYHGPDSIERLIAWGKVFGPKLGYGLEEHTMAIDTLEGIMTARPGDWIVRGIKNEFYPVEPTIFAATYEVKQEPEQTERLWRTQLEAKSVWGPVPGITYAEFFVAGRSADEKIVRALRGMPGDVRDALIQGRPFFHARANTGAAHPDDIHFSDWELS